MYDAIYVSAELSDEKIMEAWKYCAEKSHSIEIIYKSSDSDDGILTKVHFIKEEKVTKKICT